MLKITSLLALQDNYIWLLTDDDRAVVIDPGEAAPVLNALAHEALTLDAILITHHHFDHQGGVADILAASKNPVRVFAPSNESITGKNAPLSGGECLNLMGNKAEVLAVPGHTHGHLAYYFHGSPGKLFCGDTLFGAGCGRLFEGSPADMYASLQRIAALPDDTFIYCAHEYTARNLPFALLIEPENIALKNRSQAVEKLREQGLPSVPSTLLEEKKTNPFLRCADKTVIAAAKARQPDVNGDDPVAVFAVLREWRNNF